MKSFKSMKSMKKLFALMVAFVMLLNLGTAAFAADNGGTITITNATIEKTYKAYKIFDATVDGKGNIAYTYKDTLRDNPYFTADAVGNITATAAAKGEDGYLTPEAIAFLGTLKETTPTAEITATDETVVFKNLPYGYYYIESSLGSAVTIDSTNPNATVYDKNQNTSFDKNIIVGYNEDGTPILAKINDVNVGDKVEYQTKINATNYNGAKYITNYYVYDQMDEALTFNDDIKVTVNGTELAKDKYTIEYNKTLGEGESAKTYDFVINIPWVDNNGDFLYNKTNSTIIVTYSATVNEAIKTSGPMENKAEYNFAEDSKKPGKPKEDFITPDPDKPTVKTESYSTEIEICKVDSDGKPLTGAKFSISGLSSKIVIVSKEIYVKADNGEYWMLKDGKYTKDAPVTLDYMREATIDDGRDAGYVVAEDGYDKDDVVVFNNIKYRPANAEDLAGSEKLYILVKGNADLYDSTTQKYNKVTEITKENRETPVVTEGWVDENGKMTLTGLGEGTYTITELVAPNGFNLLQSPITVKITFDSKSKTFSADVSSLEESVKANNGKISFSVVNQAGTELPSTGGIGTRIFYTLGGVLVIGATILLITKKRMSVRG